MFEKSSPGNPENQQLGTIVEWVDAKGYGWVEAGGTRIFVHIKEFERGQRRPKSGEEIRFSQGIDSQGRSCARNVTFIKSGGRTGLGSLLLLLALLALPMMALLWLPFPWWQSAGAVVLVSAITYGMYAHDKQQAVTGGWRVPEATLHFAELLGGWPGAFLAQRRLRHKCSKAYYQIVFWGIVGLFQIAALDMILSYGLCDSLLSFISSRI